MVTIGKGAFKNAVGLSRFDLPSKVTVINDEVFSGCTNLTTFTVSQQADVDRQRCFLIICASLTSIYLPDDITTIGDAAFRLPFAYKRYAAG